MLPRSARERVASMRAISARHLRLNPEYEKPRRYRSSSFFPRRTSVTFPSKTLKTTPQRFSRAPSGPGTRP